MRLRGRKFAGAGIALAGALASAALAGGLFEGGDGVGDPYYPKMGNTGYDVQSYDVDLRYSRSGKVTSTTVIEAIADTDGGAPSKGPDMARFNLDFRGPGVTEVAVDGEAALSSRTGQ